MSNKTVVGAQPKFDLDSSEIDILSVILTQDASGVLNLEMNLNDHDFDAVAISDLLEQVIKTACSIPELVTLQ